MNVILVYELSTESQRLTLAHGVNNIVDIPNTSNARGLPGNQFRVTVLLQLHLSKHHAREKSPRLLMMLQRHWLDASKPVCSPAPALERTA